MLFWFIAALLTFAASLAVLVPLGRRRALADASANEIAVYRDQLAEVERDLKRGLLGNDEAEQARAEIGRRIIRADSAAKSVPNAASLSGFAKTIGTVAVVSVPLISWAFYTALGSPQMPDEPLTARLSNDVKDSSIEELVARAENSLAKNPDDVRGWDVLGPVYVRLNRIGDAAAAYRNAIRLGGSTAERESGLGEALTLASGGLITADAQAAFEAALTATPNFPKARFFLGMAMAQDGKREAAVTQWRALEAELPAENPWRSAATQMIAAANNAGQPTPESASEAAGAVQNAPPADQAAMIEGMVASLDQRLRENPNDAEGWKRLVRSYVVLGKPDQAKDALARALVALGKDGAAGRDLVSFADAQGVKVN